MKLQVPQISFIVFSILILLLSYFFLLSNFSKNVEKIFEIRKIDIFENLRNIILSYSKLSLYYSITKNLRGESHTWIYNGFNPLEFNFLKECKENITTYSINIYLSKFQISLPLNVSISSIEKCFWNLNEKDVFYGKHDEGYFYVNCSGFKIIIKAEDSLLLDINSIKNFITNNRYWYLYRKIYEWASENGEKFASCVCSLVRSCASCNEIHTCYSGLFESLEKKFENDKYIKCKKIDQAPCCYRELGDPCIDKDECLLWTKNKCHFNPKYECPTFEKKIEVFYPQIKISSSNKFIYLTCKWFENRIETSITYQCEDYKYFESTPSGPDKIVFRIGVFSGWKNYKSCIKIVRCYYDASNAKCENCKDDLCEKCLLPLENCDDNPCYSPPNYMECRNCKIKKCENEKCEIDKCEFCYNKDERC